MTFSSTSYEKLPSRPIAWSLISANLTIETWQKLFLYVTNEEKKISIYGHSCYENSDDSTQYCARFMVSSEIRSAESAFALTTDKILKEARLNDSSSPV